MDIIEAVYIINTPMFLGSTDNETAEIRPPSFKGILRFWFRALALSEFNGDISEVERVEDILFGTTRNGNQRKALYSLKISKNSVKFKEKEGEEKNTGIIYLGYGLNKYIKKEGVVKYIRSSIEPQNLIEILLIENKGIKTQISDKDLKVGFNLLIKSLKCLGIFGGLGSRTRRGFGSLTLVNLKNKGIDILDDDYCSSIDKLKKEIKELLAKSIEYGDEIDNIEYTFFSKFTKIVITKEFNDPMRLLNEIGKEMIRYRSYGKNGKLSIDEDAEKIFKPDHDLVYDYIKKAEIKNSPKRAVFGLPHNYWLSSKGINININSTNRRASPLFIHIHKLEGNKYIGILCLIPSKFLKDDDKIKISVNKGLNEINPKELETNIDYKVIEDFLDRITNNLSGEKVL